MRGELAKALEQNYDLIANGLLEALKTEKDRYVTCPHCKHRQSVSGADWTSRVKAFEVLLNQALGRREQEVRASRDPELVRQHIAALYEDLNVRPIKELSHLELQLRLVHELATNPDLLEEEEWWQTTFGWLLSRDSNATSEFATEKREHRQELRRMARLIFDTLGEREPLTA